MQTFTRELRMERLILEKPSDLRYKVHYTNEWPYSIIGIVKTPYIYGTGVIISENLILTCAHIIYHTTIPSKIQFILPSNNKNSQFNDLQIKNFYIPRKFNIDAEQPNKYDWALLYFENNNINKQKVNSLPISLLENNKSKYSITLIGYPGDKKREMYETSGEIYELCPNFLSYKLDTTTGQSGSPLLIRIEGVLSLIGIHQSSDLLIEKIDNIKVREYTNKNWGIRLTNNILKKIKSFEISQKKKKKSIEHQQQRKPISDLIIKNKNNEYCIMYFANGEKYIGQVDNKNYFHGKGIYHFSNGDKYDGIFKQGKFHGFGIFYSYNGKSEERVYENGVRVI